MSETSEEHFEDDDDDELDADVVIRRQLAIAQVRQWGDPVLRLRAHEVDTFDDELARLAS